MNRDPFLYELKPGEIDNIKNATNGNYTLVSRRFKDEISQAIARRVSPGKAGRPKKRNPTV